MRLLIVALLVLAAIIAASPNAHAISIHHLRAIAGTGGARCEGGIMSKLWDSWKGMLTPLFDKLEGKESAEKFHAQEDAFESLAAAVKEVAPKYSSKIDQEYTCPHIREYLPYYLTPLPQTMWARGGPASTQEAKDQAQKLVSDPKVKAAIAQLSSVLKQTGFSIKSDPPITFTEQDLEARLIAVVASFATPSKPKSLAFDLRRTFDSMRWSVTNLFDGNIRIDEQLANIGAAVAKSVPALKSKDRTVESMVRAAVKSPAAPVIAMADPNHPVIKEATRIAALPDVAKAIADLNKAIVRTGKFKEGAELEKAEKDILPDTRDRVITGLASALAK